MSWTGILLLVASFAVLVLGVLSLRQVASRGVLLNTMFASGALLFAAYQSSVRTQPDLVFVLPFFATMLLGGRALGSWWRSRRETELRAPARLLSGAAGVCFAALAVALLAK